MHSPPGGSLLMKMERGVSSPTAKGCSLVDRMSQDLDEVKSLIRANDLLQCRFASIQETKALQQTQMNVLEEEMKTLRTQGDKVANMQQARVHLLEAALKAFSDDNTSLRTKAAELSAFQKRIDALEGEQRNLAEQNKRLAVESGSMVHGHRALLAENKSLAHHKLRLEKELEVSQQDVREKAIVNGQLRTQMQPRQQELDDVAGVRNTNEVSINRILLLENAAANIRALRQTEQDAHTQALREARTKLSRAEEVAQDLRRSAKSRTFPSMSERQQYLAAHLELSYDFAHLESQSYTVSLELEQARMAQTTNQERIDRQVEQLTSLNGAVVRWQKACAAEGENARQRNTSIGVITNAKNEVMGELVDCKAQLEASRSKCTSLQRELEREQQAPATSIQRQTELEGELKAARELLTIAEHGIRERDAQLITLAKQAEVRRSSLMQLKHERDNARSECNKLRQVEKAKMARKPQSEERRKRFIGLDELQDTPEEALRPTIYKMYSESREVEVIVRGRVIPRGFGEWRSEVKTPEAKQLEKLEEGIVGEAENLGCAPWVLSRHECPRKTPLELEQERSKLARSPNATQPSDVNDAPAGNTTPSRREHGIHGVDSRPGEMVEPRTMASTKDKRADVHPQLMLPTLSKPIAAVKDRSQAAKYLHTPISPSSAASNNTPSPRPDKPVLPPGGEPRPREVLGNKQRSDTLPKRLQDSSGARKHSYDPSSEPLPLQKRPRHEESNDPCTHAPKWPRAFRRHSGYEESRYYRPSQYESSRSAYPDQ
ncbi:hypothetical protein LTR08_003082 [Meristemomyces frigidus]|nr:hypothetical protein LTR08_003082 [Meristemomyces frigidus]